MVRQFKDDMAWHVYYEKSELVDKVFVDSQGDVNITVSKADFISKCNRVLASYTPAKGQKIEIYNKETDDSRVFEFGSTGNYADVWISRSEGSRMYLIITHDTP